MLSKFKNIEKLKEQIIECKSNPIYTKSIEKHNKIEESIAINNKQEINFKIDESNHKKKIINIKDKEKTSDKKVLYIFTIEKR